MKRASLRRVSLLGVLPKTVRAACIEAATAAGIVPVAVLRTGQRSAMVMSTEDPRTLYIRFRGRRGCRTEWSFDPAMFSKRWRTSNLRSMKLLLADPSAPRAYAFVRERSEKKHPEVCHNNLHG